MKPQNTHYQRKATTVRTFTRYFTSNKPPQSFIRTIIGSSISTCLTISMLMYAYPVVYKHTNAGLIAYLKNNI
jgi:hypothetical protein